MSEIKKKIVVEAKDHHRKFELCKSRPAYRQGRTLTAVKVYTINDESQHLLVFGVPSINLLDDLKRTCQKYGVVESVEVIPNYPNIEEFTDVYHVHYLKRSSARYLKKKLDNQSFYGGILHVCYAPELESVNETRRKLKEKLEEVRFILKKMKQSHE